MTTLDTLGTAEPDRHEVANAAPAMALDWLAVATQHRKPTPEYRGKKKPWGEGSRAIA